MSTAVVRRHDPSRRIVLTGPVGAMKKAFGVQLGIYEVPEAGIRYRGRTGSISVPPEIRSAVVAVLGLDDRPVAKPHVRQKKKLSPAPGFTPVQLAKLYNFPPELDGTGQTIGIIELGGGYTTDDLTTYFNDLGLTPPSVTAVSIDGGMNQPGNSADVEVMLDIEVAGAVAPGANIVVYFAPNTDQGFVDAISEAAHDSANNPSVISISWGASEDSWTEQSRNAMEAALQDAAAVGVTVTVAAGDNGATDGASDGSLHVDFPAASEYVLSCGGTKVEASATAITSEVVWNELTSNEGATGGGVSKFFGLPDYQKHVGVPLQPEIRFAGRGVPDVSGDADPNTGYQIRVDGKNELIGGTSAVAPLWAGLFALMNQQLGKPLGFANPNLYQIGSPAFRDILHGTDGHYRATRGWDACTGLGSPNGATLLEALQSLPA
jgi:kumamolisin